MAEESSLGEFMLWNHTCLMARKENYLAVSVTEWLEGVTKPAENAKQ